MQVFLPYADFVESAKVLDQKRLNAMRREPLQIVECAFGVGSTSWGHHPVTKAWRDHVWWLCAYGLAICAEWTRRGYVDNQAQWFRHYQKCAPYRPQPHFMANPAVFLCYRIVLVHKDPDHYLSFWPELKGCLTRDPGINARTLYGKLLNGPIR